MKVPFQLRRSSERFPVTGLFLPCQDTSALLELCARVQKDFPESQKHLPPLFRTADGFLVKLPQAATAVYPGVVHLRSLAANLFLPCDAVLIPGLLDEEAAGLVRQRGLVFLPGGRVLAFDPQRPLQAAELLTLPRLQQRPWQPLPQRPHLAERLREVRLDLPDLPAEEVLTRGGTGIGEETPRSGSSGLGATIAGGGLVQAGKGLAWLGSLLHWQGLAQWGASLARSGMQRAPRLMESILGKQEAALRELLRQFRAGNLEEALRRALPLGGGTERGGTIARSSALPIHRLRYSLRDLLSSGQGPVSWWPTDAQLQAELAREYRKAAQEAVERGDHRRAAFIYGRLLHDFRQAAGVLARGGLHHDAAILYLEKLADRHSAAREFEAGGNLERGLELYRQTGQHIEAGNLLRRAGEEEAALQEYLLAVARLIPQDYAGAGDLLLKHAQRRDLALDYYQRGWDERPKANAFPCLMRLLGCHAETAEAGPLLELVRQADAVFAQTGNDIPAATFYNQLAQQADRTELASLREELRDRALCGLAAKLREQSAGNNASSVSELLGRSGAWQAAVVHDAEVAFKRAVEQRRGPGTSPQVGLQVGPGLVTALCSAWRTGAVFLGFASGEVCCYHPRSGRRISVPTVWTEKRAITALSCNAEGTTLVLLSPHPVGLQHLVSYHWDGQGYDVRDDRLFAPAAPSCWLTSCVAESPEVLGFWDGQELHILATADLLTLGQLALPRPTAEVSSSVSNAVPVLDMSASEPLPTGVPLGAALLYVQLSSGKIQKAMVCYEDQLWWYEESSPRGARLFPSGITSSWRKEMAPLVSRTVGGQGHLLLLDGDGFIHEVHQETGGWYVLEHRTVVGGYLAAVWLGPGKVAGVQPDRIDWLESRGSLLMPRASSPQPLADAIGCFHVPRTSVETAELVVGRDGTVLMVKRPR